MDIALSACNNTSPGIDGVKFSILKNLPVNAKLLLLDAFNWMFRNNSIPDSWRMVKIVAVLKPGKDSSKAESYRPIGLLPCPRKTLEKMIHARLECWAEKHNILSPSQYGFRQNRSTRDCQTLLATDIQIAFSKQEELAAVFLDIKGAYDAVLIDILCEKLFLLGVPKQMAMFLYNLLHFKVLHFSQNFETKAIRHSFIGLTQGSSLSPLFYNIYVSNIDSCINRNCVLIQYADDGCIWTSGRDSSFIKKSLQSSLNNLAVWATEIGFEFSVSKTELVVFSRKHNPSQISLFLQLKEIKRVDCFKYLGVWFDSKCTWGSHIRFLARKCQRRINFLRTISGTWWGAHPSDMIKLYKTTILSVMEYGCFLFQTAAKCHFIKLERIQYRCLRICLGLMTSTHTQAVEVLAGVPSLYLRFNILSCRYLVNCHISSSVVMARLDTLFELKPDCKLLTTYRECLTLNTSNSMLSHYFDSDAFAAPIDSSIDSSLIQVKSSFPNELGTMVIKYFFLEKVCRFLPETVFFTDGSFINEQAGFGVYNVNHEACFSLNSPCSIFVAEIVAIHYTLVYINSLPAQSYLICSDSASALDALRTIKISGKTCETVLKIRDLIFSLRKRNYSIHFLWVPSHSGISGNEFADTLAKHGAMHGEVYHREKETRDFYPVLNKLLINSWQRQWDDSSLGRLCHSILPSVSKVPWFSKFDVDRMFIKNMSRIISNHYTQNAHLYRIKIVATNLCECQRDYGDIDHVIWNCELYNSHRLHLRAKLQTIGKASDIPVRDVIGTMDFKTMEAINEFILRAKIQL